MNINTVNGTNVQAGQTGFTQTVDSVSKNIRSQIANAQKQLQDLSSNEELSMEAKMKKRQDIQKQISDLNHQLRQHQMEQRRGKQKEKGASIEDLLGGSGSPKTSGSKGQGSGLSQASMTAIISADSAMDQARIQGNAATQMENKASVLKAQIKRDAASGASTEAKEAELADAEQAAMNAAALQMNTLGNINKEMEETAKSDSKTEMTKDDKAEKDKLSGNEKKEPETVNAETEYGTEGKQPTAHNVSVDVRL